MSAPSLIGGDAPQRLAMVMDMMREMSRQTDPQTMVAAYSAWMRRILRSEGGLSLSRRDLIYPHYRITRSSNWKETPNPWTSRDKQPLLKGGLLAELIYKDEPTIIDQIEVSKDDPAYEYLRDHRSLTAIPLFDQGHALNMVIAFRDQGDFFSHEFLPEHLWLSNLFGRATHNLVLSDQLRQAYEIVDREMQVVADIQRSLLPLELPQIPTLEMAVYYQTSHRAGGDYYDFFELPDGQWGFLIADVSGHGTPAAVMMAVTHSIAHTHHEQPDPPSRLLNFINRHLAARYTNGNGKFVTALYGIYDPRRRRFTYSNAGHNPPRHKRAGQVVLGSLESGQNLPMGIDSDERYTDVIQDFSPGDSIVLYTDGITEARGSSGELFGLERLDHLLISEDASAEMLLRHVVASVEEFTGGAPPNDDRTLLVGRIK